ncbi:MAG TPA: hypothetical protein VI854_08525, partial [Acidimicrobiia bacterium]|nr:hypothetical protein [Acidimicrobiia bacterium]
MIQPHRFGEADELPHSPASDPDWQESVFLHWFDRSAGVGGVHRIGHEVPAGVAALWCGVFGEDGTRFRRSGAAPLKDDDVRIDGFAAAGGAHRFTFDGGPRLMVEEDRCRLDLRIEDFYPRTDFLPSEA